MGTKKSILITGATSGIGRISAEILSNLGWTVLIHGRSEEKINSTVKEIKINTKNDKVFGYKADLSDLNQTTELVKTILIDYPKLDVLINNAGLGPKHNTQFEVNFYSTAILSKGLLPCLKISQGRIINVSSAAQSTIDFNNFGSSSGMDAYCHTKLAVAMFSFKLAEVVKEDGVKVYAVDPGSLLNTQMVKESFGGPSERSPTIGADSQVKLASFSEDKLKSGQFYTEQIESKAHEQAYDKESQEKLWTLTNDYISQFF